MGLFDPRENIGPDLVAMLYSRCEGKCTACGKPLGDDRRQHDIHHRNRHGRLNGLANLIMLHHRCHLDDVHGHPQWARARGLIVSVWQDPTEAPLVLANGHVVMLSDDYHQYDETGRYDFDTPVAPSGDSG